MIYNPDMHLHSYYSDGADSPAKLVWRAKAAGIDVISITDHDGMDGVEEGVAAGRDLGIGVVRGVEFSCRYSGSFGEWDEVHILGYGMDPSNEPLRDLLAFIREKRVERNVALREKFVELGYPMSREELMVYSENGFVGKVSFAKLLVERGVARSVDEVFKSEELLRHPEVRKIRKYKLPAEDAITAIKDAGGIAILAHPFEFPARRGERSDGEAFRTTLRLLVDKLAETGLVGIECYYPTHSEDQTDYLLGIARDVGLLVSKGSDDHGEGVRRSKLMGKYAVSADLSVLQWIEDFIA